MLTVGDIDDGIFASQLLPVIDLAAEYTNNLLGRDGFNGNIGVGDKDDGAIGQISIGDRTVALFFGKFASHPAQFTVTIFYLVYSACGAGAFRGLDGDFRVAGHIACGELCQEA